MSHVKLRRRGAAAVEMAVTSIVLIPLILYTLFLQDFLNYYLESQEPGIVAAWDYTTNDYMTGDIKDVGGLNRLKYCDHTAAYDSFNKGYDCNGMSTSQSGGEAGGSGSGSGGGTDDLEVGGGAPAAEAYGHHQAAAAYQCWIVPGADQLRCYLDKNGGEDQMSGVSPAGDYLGSDWNKGGMVSCRARLGVMNYLLPKKNWGLKGNTEEGGDAKTISTKGKNTAGAASEKFTDVDKATNDKSVHGDKDNVANAWIFPDEYLAVLHDSWALNRIDDVDPQSAANGPPPTPAIIGTSPMLSPGGVEGSDTFHPLLDRSAHYYNHYADSSEAKTKGEEYFDAMKDDFLNDGVANTDRMLSGGDNPATLPVFWTASKERSNNSGYASGWADSRQSQASSGRPKYPW